MKYKIGDIVQLTDNVDLIKSNYLPERFTGTTQTITRIYSDKTSPYCFEEKKTYSINTWLLSPEQIVSLAKIDNWRERLK